MDMQFQDRYKVIRNEDIRVSTAVDTPNISGTARDKLSWIFTLELDSAATKEGEDVALLECMSCLHVSPARPPLTPTVADFRVHWLFARAMKMRWAEEVTLVCHEMVWTWMFFISRGREWKEWAVQAEHTGTAPGHASYAHKQCAMWNKLAGTCHTHFALLHPPFVTMATRLLAAMQ